jgi:hypothetical protein
MSFHWMILDLANKLAEAAITGKGKSRGTACIIEVR